MKSAALVVAIIFFMIASAHADELYEPYLSARALGMGNAYTAIVDDSDALFYNPAALCKVDGLSWTILDPAVGAGGVQNMGTLQSLKNASGNSAFINDLEQMYGQRASGDLAMKTAITLPCLEMAGFGQIHFSVSMYNPPDPTLEITANADYGEAAGIAFDLVPNTLTFGVMVKHDVRYGSDVPIGPGSLADLSESSIQSQLYNGGDGWGVDTGMNFTFPTDIKPTLSAVWHNIGYTTFTPISGATAPPRIPPDLVLGAGASWDTMLLSIRPALDIEHVDAPNEQFAKKVHTGIEFAFPIFSFRGGFYQGYYTLGAGVDMGFLRVDAATYGVEEGIYAGQDEDRRYMIQARMEVAFDADFHFDWQRAASRELKERR